MKRLGLTCTGGLLLLSCALSATADETTSRLAPGYLGIQLSQYNHEPEKLLSSLNQGSSFDLYEVTLRLGGRITDHFSSELRVGGLNDQWSSQGQKVEYDYHAGAYLRVHWPLKQIEPYLIAGYTWGRRSLDYPQDEVALQLGELVSERETLQSYSLGLGVDFNLTQQVALNIEYLQPYMQEDMAPEALSLGVLVRF